MKSFKLQSFQSKNNHDKRISRVYFPHDYKLNRTVITHFRARKNDFPEHIGYRPRLLITSHQTSVA